MMNDDPKWSTAALLDVFACYAEPAPSEKEKHLDGLLPDNVWLEFRIYNRLYWIHLRMMLALVQSSCCMIVCISLIFNATVMESNQLVLHVDDGVGRDSIAP